jgi:hypothetical protein
MDAGRQMEVSESQLRKALDPSLASFEPGSKVKVESMKQNKKHLFEILSIHGGMQIDSKAMHS